MQYKQIWHIHMSGYTSLWCFMNVHFAQLKYCMYTKILGGKDKKKG